MVQERSGFRDERVLSLLEDPAQRCRIPRALLASRVGSLPADALLAQFGKTCIDLADLAVFRRVYVAFTG